MGPTGDAVNVVQIHPTLRCNLRCQHCYSTSGPERAGALPLASLQRLLPELAAEGFNAISVSGGEPLMYEPLPQLLKTAAELGLVTSLTTNGLLLTARRLGEIAPYLRLLAVSVDGAPEATTDCGRCPPPSPRWPKSSPSFAPRESLSESSSP